MKKGLQFLFLLVIWFPSLLLAQDVVLSDEFDNGAGLWSGWIDEGQATVTFSIDDSGVLSGQNSYKAKITAGSVDTYRIQRNADLPLKAGYQYIVSFWAVADKEASINVLFEIAGDPYTKRLNQFATVTTAPQQFAYIVNATEDVADNQLKLHFGGTDNDSSTIWIDKIIVTESLDNSVVLSDEFENGSGLWSGWIDESQATVNFSIDTTGVLSGDKSYKAKITAGGADTYRIQRNAELPLKAGSLYSLSFMAVADTNASINVLFEIAGDPYTKYLNEIAEVSKTTQTYTYTVYASEDVADNQLKLHFGGTQNDSTTIWVDAIEVREVPAVFAENFDNGSGLWSGWIDESQATVNFSIDTTGVLSGDKSYKAAITAGGADTYRIQRNAELPLKAGNLYSVSFMAVADTNASINVLFEIAGDPYTKYLNEIVEVSTTPQTFTYSAYVNEDVADNQLKLHFGGTQNDSTTIWVDFITVSEIELPEVITAVQIDSDGLTPNSYDLGQNYPNPFNPTTTIEFSLPQNSHVKLVVYDAIGRAVSELVNKEMSAGHYKTNFNAANLASGVYFYRIEAGKFVTTKKLMLLK